MGTELSTFDEIEIEKNKFYRSYLFSSNQLGFFSQKR